MKKITEPTSAQKPKAASAQVLPAPPPILASISPYPLVQLGWSVPDYRSAAENWLKLAGVGPFFVQEHVPMHNVIYRGKQTTYDHSIAIGWWGGVEIELMQQHCTNPSHMRDVVPNGGYGFVSVSWFAPDLDAETRRLEALGFPLYWSGEFGSGMSARWFDARHVLGAAIEVFPEHEMMRQGFSRLERIAKAWNGDRPIREMGELFPLDLPE
jgi:Glyoxalase/Bleomycin resistance protein/Dioxygenase superfamily